MEGRPDGVRRSPPPLPRRCRDYPSFSSTLLDAIYRSIDDTDGVTKGQRPSGAPDTISARKKNAGGVSERKKHLPAVIFPGREQSGRRRCTSSSSDGSSYGGFSSSDPESVSAAQHVTLRPIRTTPSARTARFRPDDGQDPPIPSRIEEKRAKKERHGSIRSRLRDLTNGRAPSSPGARLANFLNSMFSAKSKVSAVSSCAAASSYSHSCLKRTPAATGKRTVRFSPVSVIVGDVDCSPCGEKWVYGGDRTPAVTSAEAVEEDAGSDSSSDLFELKNLASVGRLRDELPVYDTTRLGNYGCISRSLTKISTKTLEKDKYKERS